MAIDFVLSDVLGAVLVLIGVPAALGLATWALRRYSLRENVITITVHEPRKPIIAKTMSARRARRYR